MRQEAQVPYADVHVGDILKIQQDQTFPADILVIGSNLAGICYIETGALDGEKNLKPRSSLTETAHFFTEDGEGFLNLNNNFHLEI